MCLCWSSLTYPLLLPLTPPRVPSPPPPHTHTHSYMDPYREGRKEAKRQAALLKQRLGRNIELNEFELVSRGD